MTLLGVFLICILPIFYLVNAVLLFLRKRSMINKVPGPWAYFIFGNAIALKREAADFFEQSVGVAVMFPLSKMFRFWIGTTPAIVIYGADETEAVLSNVKHVNKSDEYNFLIPWMGFGLLTSTADYWRTRRKALTPTFHYDILKDFIPVFNEQSKILITKLHEICDNPIDIHKTLALCALDIICETAMGHKLGAQNCDNSEYVCAARLINELIHERQKSPWFWPNWSYRLFGEGRAHDKCLRVMHEFTDKVIEDRQAQRLKSSNSSSQTRRLAFLDLLLDLAAKGVLTISDVREETDTFMFAGHDTTSTAMSWTLFLLGSSRLHQDKVLDEINSVFGDSQRDITNDDFPKLKYLEQCIKEAMRIYPPVPLLGRQILEDTEICGYQIPANTRVLIFPYVMHRDPRHWPDPEIFDPDRFSQDRSAGRHPYCYLPFAAGPRNCLGQRFAIMEMKALLSWILRHFRVKSLLRRDQVLPEAKIIVKAKPAILLQLKPHRT